MAEEEKPPGPSSSTHLPSPSSSDQSLVRVFGGLENALIDLKMAVLLLDKNHHKEHRKLAEQINNMHLDVVRLTEAHLRQATAEGITLAATVDAREALDRTREKLEETGAKLKRAIDESGQFLTPEAAGDAPRFVQVVVVRLTNLGWRYFVKLSFASLGAGGALWELWQSISKL